MFSGSPRRVGISMALLGSALVVAAATLPSAHLVMVLNGALAGATVGVGMVYRRLIVEAVRGTDLSPGVAAYVVSVALLWLATLVGVFNSLALRVIFDIPIPTTALTIVMRIVALIAAVLQVAAPNLTSGAFFHRDTRVLLRALAVGGIVSLLIYVAQLGGPTR